MAKKIKENVQENIQDSDLSKGLAKLIEQNLRPVEEITYGEGDEKLTIKVYPQPPIGRAMEATRTAADLFFSLENEGTVDSIITAVSEFALRYGTLLCFTDFVAPEKILNAYASIMYTPIFDDVVDKLHEDENLSYCPVCEFIDGVLELVEAKKQEIYHSVNFGKIFEKLTNVITNAGESLKDFDLSKFDFSKFGAAFENLPKDLINQELTNGIFDSLKDMTKKNK